MRICTAEVNMEALYSMPKARFFVRISNESTINLSTGKKIKLEKKFFRRRIYTYEGVLTKDEEKELKDAIKIIG